MRCPFCDGRMDRGFVAAASTRRGDTTRLEWFGNKPRIASVDGQPLTDYGRPGTREAQRCRECGAVIID